MESPVLDVTSHQKGYPWENLGEASNVWNLHKFHKLVWAGLVYQQYTILSLILNDMNVSVQVRLRLSPSINQPSSRKRDIWLNEVSPPAAGQGTHGKYGARMVKNRTWHHVCVCVCVIFLSDFSLNQLLVFAGHSRNQHHLQQRTVYLHSCGWIPPAPEICHEVNQCATHKVPGKIRRQNFACLVFGHHCTNVVT